MGSGDGTGKRILNPVTEVTMEEGSTILVISHQERILSIADEIIVLAAGRVEKRGTSQEILPEILETESAMGMCERLKCN